MSATANQKPLSHRVFDASAAVDGVACVLRDLVQSEDKDTSRKSFVCADLLERVSADLDAITLEINKLTHAVD